MAQRVPIANLLTTDKTLSRAVFVRARIGKRLSDFTDYNMRIYEVAAVWAVFIEYANSQLPREYFYPVMIAICCRVYATD